MDLNHIRQGQRQDFVTDACYHHPHRPSVQAHVIGAELMEPGDLRDAPEQRVQASTCHVTRIYLVYTCACHAQSACALDGSC